MASFFAFADTLYLYWSDDLVSKERLGAIFRGSHLEILDQEAYDKFVSKFKRDRALLAQEGKEIPSWEEIIQTKLKNQN